MITMIIDKPSFFEGKFPVSKFLDGENGFSFLPDTGMGGTLIFHGGEDGSASLSTNDLARLVGKVTRIFCCYPKRVLAKYPQLKGKIAFPQADCQIQQSVKMLSGGKVAITWSPIQ